MIQGVSVLVYATQDSQSHTAYGYKNQSLSDNRTYQRHRFKNPNARSVQLVGGSTRLFIIRNIFCLEDSFSKNKGGFVVSISTTVQPTLLKAMKER